MIAVVVAAGDVDGDDDGSVANGDCDQMNWLDVRRQCDATTERVVNQKTKNMFPGVCLADE